MPNYCYNRLFAKKEFIDNYLNDEKDFDFNKIIAQPSIYKEDGPNDESTMTPINLYIYLSKKGHDPKLWKTLEDRNGESRHIFFFNKRDESNYDEAQAKKCVEAYYNYGATTWYYWNIKHWGTKWNAFNTQVIALNGDDECIEFCTAWTEPTGVIKALRAINPNFKWLYRDEEDEEWKEA